jgi:hypothetical protein
VAHWRAASRAEDCCHSRGETEPFVANRGHSNPSSPAQATTRSAVSTRPPRVVPFADADRSTSATVRNPCRRAWLSAANAGRSNSNHWRATLASRNIRCSREALLDSTSRLRSGPGKRFAPQGLREVRRPAAAPAMRNLQIQYRFAGGSAGTRPAISPESNTATCAAADTSRTEIVRSFQCFLRAIEIFPRACRGRADLASCVGLTTD